MYCWFFAHLISEVKESLNTFVFLYIFLLSFLTFTLRSQEILSVHQLIFRWAVPSGNFQMDNIYFLFHLGFLELYSNLHTFIYIQVVLFSDIENRKIASLSYPDALVSQQNSFYLISDRVLYKLKRCMNVGHVVKKIFTAIGETVCQLRNVSGTSHLISYSNLTILNIGIFCF